MKTHERPVEQLSSGELLAVIDYGNGV